MTNYEHGPGCTLGPTGDQCDDCKRKYPQPLDWACTCGTVNSAADRRCVNCNRARLGMIGTVVHETTKDCGTAQGFSDERPKGAQRRSRVQGLK